MAKLTQEQKVAMGLKLYQYRSQLLKLGCLQPVKWMIERKLWHDDPNNHNYLNGRIINTQFIEGLDKLINQLEKE